MYIESALQCIRSKCAFYRGTVMVMIVVLMQSVPNTTKVVSSNTAHGEVYSIQHYVIKFVIDLREVCGFLSTPVSSTKKTGHYNITEILLKVALNTITLTLTQHSIFVGFYWMML